MKRFTFDDAKERELFNLVAREQMKLKLLQDIRLDLAICEIEGWDKREYIKEIRNMLNEIKL